MDHVASQNSGARDVYRDSPDPTFQTCFALVGSTMFGRAVSSVFIGLQPAARAHPHVRHVRGGAVVDPARPQQAAR